MSDSHRRQHQQSTFLGLVLLAYDIRLLLHDDPRNYALAPALRLAQGIGAVNAPCVRGRVVAIKRVVTRWARESDRRERVLERLERIEAALA